MQIQLKQAEIITALKGYISSQGINLNGKSVDITFTAGRKEGGLTADLVIEDAFTEEPVAAPAAATAVFVPQVVKTFAPEQSPETVTAEADPEPAEAKPTSLFS